MIKLQTFRILVLFSVISLMPGHAELSTSDLLYRLLEGDQQVIPALVERKEEALPLLRRLMTPDPAEVLVYLERLGAANFQDRSAATEALIALGGDIREQVEAFRRENAHDPEIVHRCNLVLKKRTEGASAEQDLAIVTFFMACGDLEASVVRQFGDSFRRVFERKALPVLQEAGSGQSPESLYDFARHYVQLPGGEDDLVTWVLGQSNRQWVLETVRILLNWDFEKFLPLVTQTGRHANTIERMVVREFAARFGEKEILHHLKSIYDASNHPVEVEFDPETEVTPDIAFAIMNRRGMRRLEPVHYDLLFEKLEPMPSEELLRRLSEKPVEGFFMQQLAERRTDLREALASLVMTQVGEIENISLWNMYLRVARDSLGVTFAEGDLDEEWARIMHHHEGVTGVLTGSVASWNLSPAHVLKLISQYADQIEKHPNSHVATFVHLFDADDPEVRRGAVELALATMTGSEHFNSNIQSLWTSALRHPEADDPALTKKKFELLGKLRPREGAEPFPLLGSSGIRKDFQAVLSGFYGANREWLNQLFQEEPLRPGVADLINYLSWYPGIEPETGERLRDVVVRFLEKADLEPGEKKAALLSGLNLGLRDPVWDRALLEHLQTEISSPFEFPLWRLDGHYRDLLTKLEERIDTPEGLNLSLLCAGIMIQPDHPFWTPRIDRLLRETGDVMEVGHLMRALVIVNREPDLSKLDDTRLAELFNATDAQAIERTDDFLPKLFRLENKALALRLLEPHLKDLMAHEKYLSGLNDSFYLVPEAWGILGETLLNLLETGPLAQKRSAASSLTAMNLVPASVIPRLEKLLADGDADISIRLSLLWIVARMGPEASSLTEVVREIPAEHPRLRLRRAFALASISPVASEREEHLNLLKEAYLTEPSWLRLRKIGLLRTMDTETLPFFQELIRRGFREDARKLQVHYLREIVYRATNFPDPQVAWEMYHEILETLRDPDVAQPGMRGLADPVFQRLIQHYPDRLDELRPLIEQLPEELKRSWRYRQLHEIMSPQ
ncbi:MAG: hypothetical protein JJU29_22950 [Verrucomicrobia bacterium]|nr:hypothetical protein [Verrucomicrobiota bacterium]MCH8514572.1 hypothetical protein [Kiritimatiellia bacterium]